MVGIYKITNKENGKVYIGQSNNVERRISEHQKARTMTIDAYINVLGVDKFDFEILEECPEEELDNKEQQYIAEYDSCKNGYNIQSGGFNNAQGENNGRARLTEADVRFLRRCYAEHRPQKEIYETYFADKISKNAFQTAWQGRSWTNIMPEVFTPENKLYYTSIQNKTKAKLSPEEVLCYRKYYVDHTRAETLEKFIEDYGPDFLKPRTFEKILTGDVRDISIYLDVPVYKKTLKRWELNGVPVSTSDGSVT